MPPSPTPFICIGAALWDLVARAAADLAPHGDVPGRVTRRPGGVAANVAMALARRGHPVHLLGAVGRDTAGVDLVDVLEAEGIDCRDLYRGGRTDTYVALEDPAGELFAAVADCTALERAGDAVLAPLTDGRLGSAASPWTGWLVVDGNLPAPTLARFAAEPALRPARLAIIAASAAKAPRLAPLVGHPRATLYANRREAEALTGQRFADSAAAVRALLAGGLAAALVTDGAAPAAWGAGACIRTRTPEPAPRRSVTGAGDALVAAHLAATAAGLAPEQCLAQAVAAATLHLGRPPA